jgi:hypothetical protein
MSAKVLFLSKPSDVSPAAMRSMLTVPLTTVATRSGRKVVYVVRENKAVEVPVMVGKELGSLVEIKDGLSVGERVIGKPDERIANGTKVKVQ